MKHLKPKEAQEFLKTKPNALFIDCRSEMEYLFVGHPAGALHVAWNDGADWEVNPHFVGQVKKVAGTNHAHRPIGVGLPERRRRGGDERDGEGDAHDMAMHGDLLRAQARYTGSGWVKNECRM